MAVESNGPVAFGDAVWDNQERRLTVRGQAVPIPYRAALCLQALVAADGHPVSRETLLDSVWEGAAVEDSNLSHCVVTLRKALDPAPDGTSYIETVPRIGYRLVPRTKPAAAPPVATGQVPRTAEVAPRPQPAAPHAVAPAVRPRRWVKVAVIVVAAGLAFTGFALAGGGEERREIERAAEDAIAMLRRSNTADATAAAAELTLLTERAPTSAVVRSGLAEAMARLGNGPFDTALGLARSAVADDPACDECQAILGYILMTRFWQWEESGRWLRQAVARDGRSVQRRLWLATWHSIRRDLAAAERELAATRTLAVADAQVLSAAAMIAYFQGRYDDALRFGDEAVALDPRHEPGFYWPSRAYMALGDDLNAAAARAKGVTAWMGLSRDRESDLLATATADARRGRRVLVGKWLEDVGAGRARDVHRFNRAVWRMWVGDHEGALDELEGAVESRPYNVIFTAVDPIFSPLHGRPRFQAVLGGLGLSSLIE